MEVIPPFFSKTAEKNDNKDSIISVKITKSFGFVMNVIIQDILCDVGLGNNS
jgi:hypothetical protein